MALLTVAEAAERLGVTVRRVQHLVAGGTLRSVARGVVDEASVERYLASRGGFRWRPWSEPTAWGAVALLSGRDAAWMGESQRSRLRGRLRELSAGELAGRARGRAEASRYTGHTSTAGRLRGQVVDTSAAAEALGLTATAAVDGYVAAGDLDALVARHGLIRDDAGPFTLRATGMAIDVVADLARTGPVVAALDLAESLDVRERRAGVDALTDALERFRG
ncbi:helix-turn-helix domain-containing protein [Dactylosporangium sp. NBC_01737]|uniref:helix-turn-helix domain-containing protein n=1 Tax=Dactylosporangium sp. NBC_01737 TaxID=2975959 RepID=UPI002E0EFC08|nr:helix-turn-helix domain-containing protein [Dactylosporangium sp. NBC_01737]